MLLDVDGIVRHSDEMYKIHYGEVVNNEDPKKLGRVKCKVEFLLEGSPDDLPWVYPDDSSPTDFYVPQVGEKLKIRFKDGDIYYPEYVGYYHSSKNHSADFDADYPDSFGISRKGFKAKYNMKEKLLEIIMPDGSFFKMNKDGDVLVEAKGKVDIKSEKDMTFTPKGKYTVKATGKVSITSDADLEVFGKSKTTLGSAQSQTIVNGLQVSLGGEGGNPVAYLGATVISTFLGIPTIGQIVQGSSKVMTAP